MKSILRFLASQELTIAWGLRFLPSTYQSEQLDRAYSHIEKRGSRYLHYALYNATKYACYWDQHLLNRIYRAQHISKIHLCTLFKNFPLKIKINL